MTNSEKPTLTSNERLLELVGELDHYAETEGYERGYPGGLSPGQRKRARAELEAGIRALTAPETSDVLDAAKWRALRNCARITAIGSAGMGPERAADDYAHITLNFWTGVPDGDPGPAYAREWLDTFVDKALRGSLKASEPHAWHFNRYRNGRLMAEGVTVHTATEAEAWEKAESLKRQFQLPTDELRLSQSEPEV